MTKELSMSTSRTPGALLGTLLLFGITPSALSAQTTLEEVLAAARSAARGAPAAEHGRDFHGKALFQGVECQFELFLDQDGRFRFEVDGPLAQAVVWDGTKASRREGGGPLQVLTHEARDEQAFPQWLHSGYWLDQGAPLTIEMLEQSAAQVTLRVDCNGSTIGGEVLLDRETWLPVELRQESGSGPNITTFADYREVAGSPVAHRVTTRLGGGEGWIQVRRASAAAAPDSCSIEAAPPADTHFDPSVPSKLELKRVPSGHLLVQPRVNGEDRGWFILDSGAGKSCIDPKVADELGLDEFGQIPAMGVGGTVMTSFRSADRFSLGPLQISEPVFVELDLSFLEPVFGVQVAGVCGYDVFARAVVELDLETPSLRIHNPESHVLADGEWSELVLDDRLPCIHGKFEGEHSGLFKIDTGDAGTVVFYTPAVEEYGLLEGREVRRSSVAGVGGSGSASAGELEWIEIGKRRFEAVDATFSQTTTGAFTDDSVLGSLGGQLLRPFLLVFDYPSARIALVERPE